MNKLNKLTTEMLFFKSENKDVNYLEGGGVFIEDKNMSLLYKKVMELEIKLQELSHFISQNLSQK